MAEKGDITFTFDTTQFKGAMKDVSKGMSGIQNNTKDMSGKVSSGIVSGFSKMAMAIGAVVMAVKGALATVSKYLPEIGTTFEIASNIFFKNFLFPLRKELLPIMQSLLSWTRKNRGMFVEMGGVLVNVFKVVKTYFASVINALSPYIDMVKKLLGSIFGDTSKSISETVNLVLVKIMAFTIFVSDLVKPVFEGIASAIGVVIDVIKNFTESFISGFSKVFDSGNALDLLTLLSDTFKALGEAIVPLIPVAKLVGEVLGTYLGTGLNVAIDTLKILFFLLKAIFSLIANPKRYKEIFSQFGKDLVADIKHMGSTITAGYEKEKDIFKGVLKGGEQAQDVIITKSGRVIKTHPQDDIIASRGGGITGKSVSLSMNFGDFHLTTTEGNAETAGRNFINGIEKQIRNVLLNNLASEGSI